MMINVFIVEDSEEDFKFIKKILKASGFNTNEFDNKFRAHFEKYCNTGTDEDEMSMASEYIKKNISNFEEKNGKISLFLMDFELFQEGIEYCNSLRFIDNFLDKNYNDRKKIIISIDVKNYHNELVMKELFWIKKYNYWKENTSNGINWQDTFVKIINSRLSKDESIELKISVITKELEVLKEDVLEDKIQMLYLINLLYEDLKVPNKKIDFSKFDGLIQKLASISEAAAILKNLKELKELIFNN